MKIVIRLLLIVAGYEIACAAAGLVVSLAVIALPGTLWADGGSPVAQIFQITALVCVFATLLTAGLALGAITILEYKGLRHPLIYIVIGMITGLCLAMLLKVETWFPAIGSAAGALAGFVYWGTAGRSAGALFADQEAGSRTMLFVLLVISAVASVVSASVFIGVPGQF